MGNPDLRIIEADNIRDNQIGGKVDGITPEVAADLGFTVPQDLSRIEGLDVGAERQLLHLDSSGQPLGERTEVDKFIDPQPGEDGTPEAVGTKADTGMSREVKERLLSRIGQNAAMAAERGIETSTESDDEYLTQSPVASNPQGGHKKRKRGNRAGKKVQARRTRAQMNAIRHRAEAKAKDRTPKLDGQPLETPEF